MKIKNRSKQETIKNNVKLEKTSWFDYIKNFDENLYNFLIESLERGYSFNNISEDLITQIKELLVQEDLENVKRFIPYITNHPNFQNHRIEYEIKQVRYTKIFNFVKNWINGGNDILDVGCGNGNMAYFFLDDDNVNYTGTDVYLPNDIDSCLISSKNISFLLQDSPVNIPVLDESMDIILIIDMLHHIEFKDQSNFLEDIYRKLKPDGRVIIFEYCFSEKEKGILNNEATNEYNKLTIMEKMNYLLLMDWLSNILFLNRTMPMPYSFKTKEEWELMFKKLNFNIESSKYLGFPEEFFHQGPYSKFLLSK